PTLGLTTHDLELHPLEPGGLGTDLGNGGAHELVVGEDPSDTAVRIDQRIADGGAVTGLVDDPAPLPVHQQGTGERARRQEETPGRDTVQARGGGAHTAAQFDTAAVVTGTTQRQTVPVDGSMFAHHGPI